ncbi:hypothetical protein PUR61_21045, partial [Streptomyces sp. BE20]|nr:hypothetical protein [Streptomyces sp. BE20]
MIVVLALFGVLNDNFLSLGNMQVIAEAATITGLLAIVQTVVIICGGGPSGLAHAHAGDQPLRSGPDTLDGRTQRTGHPGDAIRAGLGFAPEERKAQALFLHRSI